MTQRLGLPRLFGLPWEAGGNGQAGLLPAGLTPFATLGSPLVKAPGEPITVTWGARNSGQETGYVVTEVLAGGVSIGRLGPVGILGGNQVTLAPSATAPSTPGPYNGQIVLRQTDSAGVNIKDFASDTFQLTVSTSARFSVGQRVHLLGSQFVGTVQTVFLAGEWTYNVGFTDPRINPVVTIQESALEPDPGIPITAPSLSITSPLEGSSWPRGQAITYSGTASNYKGEDLSGLINWYREFWDAGEEWWLRTYINTGPSATTVPERGVLAQIVDSNSGLHAQVMRNVNLV